MSYLPLTTNLSLNSYALFGNRYLPFFQNPMTIQSLYSILCNVQKNERRGRYLQVHFTLSDNTGDALFDLFV